MSAVRHGRMTCYERITLLLAVGALVWSAWLQWTAYRYFLPAVREFQLKSTSIFADGVHAVETTEKKVTEYWSVTVENRGELPVNNLAVTFKTAELATAEPLTVDPPLPHNTEIKGDTADITLSAPLAPRSKMTVVLRTKKGVNSATLASVPDVSAWVSSEANITQVGWRQARTVNLRVTIGPASGSVSANPDSRKH